MAVSIVVGLVVGALVALVPMLARWLGPRASGLFTRFRRQAPTAAAPSTAAARASRRAARVVLLEADRDVAEHQTEAERDTSRALDTEPTEAEIDARIARIERRRP